MQNADGTSRRVQRHHLLFLALEQCNLNCIYSDAMSVRRARRATPSQDWLHRLELSRGIGAAKCAKMPRLPVAMIQLCLAQSAEVLSGRRSPCPATPGSAGLLRSGLDGHPGGGFPKSSVEATAWPSQLRDEGTSGAALLLWDLVMGI